MSVIREHFYEAIAALGSGAVLYGVGLMHRPSAWIAGGIMAVAFAIVCERARPTR